MTAGGKLEPLLLCVSFNPNQFRVFLDAKPDLLSLFADLAKNSKLPDIEALILQAGILVDRYASQDAYEQALSKSDSIDAPIPMKVASGPSWRGSESSSRDLSNVATDIEAHANVLHSQDNNPPPLPSENLPKVHQETEAFDGDRVLANSILFLQDFGWWIELGYAVPEGDIGRVFEILKVRNFDSKSFTY